MASADVKLREWGNSYGIVLPKDKVIEEGLKVDDELRIEFKKKKSPLREIYGAAKRMGIKFSKPTDELLREADDALSPKDW